MVRIGDCSTTACLKLVSNRTDGQTDSNWNGEIFGLIYQEGIKDHFEAYRFYYGYSSLSRLNKIWSVLLLVFGLFLVLTVGAHWWSLIWIPLAVAEWLNLMGLADLYFTFLRKNESSDQANKFIFSASGVHFRNHTSESHLKWSSFIYYLESRNCFLLVQGSWSYSVVPKRIFNNGVDLARFRAMLEEHVGSVQSVRAAF